MVPPVVKQTWAMSGVLLNMVGHGMVFGYTSSLLPALQAPDSDIKIDLQMASWLASAFGWTWVLGFLITSLLMDWRGRKQTYVLVTIPAILSWLLIYYASNVTALMVGRLLSGCSIGATLIFGAFVIGEYSSPKNRGIFLNLKTAGLCFGTMIVHILCYYIHWRTIALVGMIPYVMSVIITCTWPESPAWLASRKEFQKCETAFHWLRGHNEESRKELNELIRTHRAKSPSTKQVRVNKFTEFLKKFTRKDFIKPVIIITLFAILLESCGRHVFPGYAIQIIEEVAGDKFLSFYYTLAIDIIITGSAIFSSVVVKMYKRRTILFVTGFSAMCVIFCACIYLYLISKDIVSKNYQWISIAFFLLFFILVNVGCIPISIALLGEVLPLAHKAAGSAVGGFVVSVSVMGSLKVTPYLLNNIKVYGTFSVFGATMGLLLGILYFILPETKDKTLEDIEDYFNYGKFRVADGVNADDEDVTMKINI